MHGPIPEVLGSLTKLKCIYLSHTGVEGLLPRSLENLTQLQVFLMRNNNLAGPLIDFSKLPLLKNVWFDTQNLTGTLNTLGLLKNLTYLQASKNPGITGDVPAKLCAIECDAAGTAVTCGNGIPSGCCDLKCPTETTVSNAQNVLPVKPSMGECIPQ